MSYTRCFAPFAVLALSCKALAAGDLAQVSIIDRETGLALTPHLYHGEYWVAGRPGATYAIEIHNRLNERLLAVTSVDGVNAVSGATAGWNQTGYVFDAYQRYQIAGWRKSAAEVAAFTFTASPNSYAERTGRPANVGVIGVALFRERRPERASIAQPDESTSDESTSKGERNEPPESSRKSAAAPPPSPLAAAAASRSAASQTGSFASHSHSTMPSPAPAAPKLGTGHGAREYSYVTYTAFERMQDQPNEIVSIHYDRLENLVAMGIVKAPHRASPVVNPFPDSPGHQYVPDPPGENAGELP